MSKAPTSDLHQLISTLTGSEKRYFKLYASRHVLNGQNQYARMFDMIEGQSVYDEEKIKKGVKSKGNAFSDQKRHVYEMVLKSLGAFHSDSTIESDLTNALFQIQLLFQKGLFNQCKLPLKKLISRALKYEKYHVLFRALIFERRLIFSDLYMQSATTRLQENYEETRRALEALSRLDEITRISSELYLILREEDFLRSNKLRKKAQEIYDEIIAMKITHDDPFLVQLEFYKALTYYSYTVGLLSDCVRYSYIQVEILENNPWYFDEDPRSYLILYYNLCLTLVENKLFAETRKYQPKLTDKRFDSPAFGALKFWLNFEIGLLLHLRSDDIKRGFEFVEKEKKEFDHFEQQIHPTYRYQLAFNAAVICFKHKSYHRCLSWLNKILNDPAAVKESKYYYDFAILLNLVTYYELEDFDYLEHVTRSAGLKMKKNDLYFELEEMLLKFIRKSVRLHEKDVKPVKELRTGLLTWATSEENKKLLQTFDFIEWCDGHLKK